jgi:hypothetical protein
MVRQAYASAIARATVGAVVSSASRLPEALKSSLTTPPKSRTLSVYKIHHHRSITG